MSIALRIEVKSQEVEARLQTLMAGLTIPPRCARRRARFSRHSDIAELLQHSCKGRAEALKIRATRNSPVTTLAGGQGAVVFSQR
jgi:hypothetical protein